MISSGSIHNVAGDTSQKTGVAPVIKTAFEVAMNVKFGTITSSPGPIFKDFKQA